jgi:hypothetical protein
MDGDVRIIQQPHVLAPRKLDFTLPAGSNLAEFLEAAGLTVKPNETVFLNEEIIPPDAWPTVYPRAEDLVRVAVVPEGEGDGRKTVRTVAMIVVMVAAAYVAGPAGPGGVWGAMAGASIAMGGSFLVNAFLPMPLTTPRLADLTRTEGARSLSGSRNRPNPFGALPRVYGRTRLYPPLAANPFVLCEGDEQYMYLL